MALQYCAKRRTIPKRLAHCAGFASGKFCGDAGRADAIGELDKSLQKASRQTQLVPEGATPGEIFIERRLQRAHIAAPGHGSAMPRSDAISTLA